jgi:hypothetical protein
VFWEALPYTPMGKLLRREVRASLTPADASGTTP